MSRCAPTPSRTYHAERAAVHKLATSALRSSCAALKVERVPSCAIPVLHHAIRLVRNPDFGAASKHCAFPRAARAARHRMRRAFLSSSTVRVRPRAPRRARA
jgi:hypothetical protein